MTTVCDTRLVIARSRAERRTAEKPATSARLRTASLLRPTTGTEMAATIMRIISVTISSRSVKPLAARACRPRALTAVPFAISGPAMT